MRLKLFCLFLCLLPAPLFACIRGVSGIRAVYYRGGHEMAGRYTWEITDDLLHEASAASPLYINFRLDHSAVFADTLVLQSSGDPTLSQPINLPLILDGAKNVTLVAEPDAVRIVRWVAGEDSIWVEIRQSSNEWLDFDGSLGGPNVDNQVSFGFGMSAREYDTTYQLGPLANLPFATRNAAAKEGEFADAVSVLHCVDLRNATLTADGSSESLLSDDNRLYYSDANQGNGVYAPGSLVPCIDFGIVNSFAQGKSYACTQHSAQIHTSTILAGPAGMRRVQQNLSAFQSCNAGANLLVPTWAEGSYVHLTAMGSNSGFEANPNVSFANGWSGTAVVRAGSAFQINGITLYRELDLYYLGPGQSTLSQSLDLDVEVIYAPDGHTQPQLGIETVLLPFATANDTAPYSGATQGLRCAPEAYTIANQTLALGVATVPTLGEVGQILLLLSLVGAAIVQQRRAMTRG